MNELKKHAFWLYRTTYCLAVTTSLWLVMANTALARYKDPDDPANAGPTEKSYTLPYMLVVMCIALGLMVLFRPSGRANEPKYPQHEKD